MCRLFTFFGRHSNSDLAFLSKSSVAEEQVELFFPAFFTFFFWLSTISPSEWFGVCCWKNWREQGGGGRDGGFMEYMYTMLGAIHHFAGAAGLESWKSVLVACCGDFQGKKCHCSCCYYFCWKTGNNFYEYKCIQLVCPHFFRQSGRRQEKFFSGQKNRVI